VVCPHGIPPQVALQARADALAMATKQPGTVAEMGWWACFPEDSGTPRKSQYVVGFVPQPSSGALNKHKLEIKVASKSSGTLVDGKRTAIY